MAKWMERFGFKQRQIKELISAVTLGHPDKDYTVEDAVFLACYATAMTRLIIDRMNKLEQGRGMARLSIAEAARISGRSVSTIKRAVRSRRLLSEKIGGRRYIDRASFEAYFERDLTDVYEVRPRPRKRAPEQTEQPSETQCHHRAAAGTIPDAEI